MKDIVIVSACRTPIGAFGGTLKELDAACIGAVTMKEAVRRAGIDPAIIDDVRFGNCLEPCDALNVARVSALLAGIPESVTAVTINRVCISGMEAVISGMAMIQAGMAEVILAGGVEHMSGVAYQVPGARWGYRLQDQVFVDAMIRALHCGSYILPLDDKAPLETNRAPANLFIGKPYIMGHTAEFVAQRLGIGREEMDEVALRSHNNAERATREGVFAEEIVSMEIPRHKKPPLIFDKDEHFRPGITMEDLKKLPPAFHPQNRNGYGRQFQRHQRRFGRHDHHVRRKSKRSGDSSDGPDPGSGPWGVPPGGYGAVSGARGTQLDGPQRPQNR